MNSAKLPACLDGTEADDPSTLKSEIVHLNRIGNVTNWNGLGSRNLTRLSRTSSKPDTLHPLPVRMHSKANKPAHHEMRCEDRLMAP